MFWHSEYFLAFAAQDALLWGKATIAFNVPGTHEPADGFLVG